MELAKVLLSRGTNFDFESPFALSALIEGVFVIIELILAASKFDVNTTFSGRYDSHFKVQSEKPRSVFASNMSLLMIACSEGMNEAVQLLLEAGANPNAKDTTFQYASLQ